MIAARYHWCQNRQPIPYPRRTKHPTAKGWTKWRDVAKDEVLTYDDVVLPPGRLADTLRAEQYRHFRGETWLEDRLKVAA